MEVTNSDHTEPKRKWLYPVVYLMFVVISLLPLYAEKPYAPQYWAQTAKKSSGPGGDYYRTRGAYLGERYVETAFSRYYQDRISVEQLADYLGVKPRNVPGMEDLLFPKGGDSMIYVFDSSSLIELFRYYYPDRFPSLWASFDALVSEHRIISVREVRRELEGRGDRLPDWVKGNTQLFPIPTTDEFDFVTEIFQITHFQALVRKKERLNGKPVADPFVIAKAYSLEIDRLSIC